MEVATLAYVVGGSAILGCIFQLFSQRGLEKYAVGQGMLSADRSIKIGFLFMLLCGALCFFEEVRHFGAYGLAFYMAVSAILIHKFWDAPDRATQVAEGLHFIKNIILAALLVGIAMVLEQV